MSATGQSIKNLLHEALPDNNLEKITPSILRWALDLIVDFSDGGFDPSTVEVYKMRTTDDGSGAAELVYEVTELFGKKVIDAVIEGMPIEDITKVTLTDDLGTLKGILTFSADLNLMPDQRINLLYRPK